MKLFSILKKDLLILFRNRAEMAVLFLMPLAFILPISFALGSGDGYGINRSNEMILLPVVDYDRGPRALALLNAAGESLKLEKEFGPELIEAVGLSDDPDCQPVVVETTPTPAPTGTPEAEVTPTPQSEEEILIDNPACVEKVSRAMLQKSWRPAMLVIPAGFSKAVNAGEKVEVQLIFDPAGDTIRIQQIEGVVEGAAIRLSLENQVSGGLSSLNDLASLAPDNVRLSIRNKVAAPQPENQQPAVQLVKVSPENFQARRTPDTYQQTIPGYTVMYVFFIITSMTSSIRQERLVGTFRRLLTTPVSRIELLGGKLLASLIVGMAQVFILFLVGALIFRLNLGNDPLAFLLLTFALVAAATTLGLAASTTRIKGGGIAAPLVIAALLGGCMFPLDLMSSLLRSLSVLVPHSWALNGFQNLMVRGQGLQEVFPQIMALLAFALLFFLIALFRFDFESD